MQSITHPIKEYLTRNKMTISQMIVYFMFYSIIGWCYEVFLEVVVYRWGFTNRGVLFGPYTPVYGVGAILFLIFVYPVIIDKHGAEKWKQVWKVFLLSMLIATAVELAASYILEWTTGSWPWQTYERWNPNFQARIALNPSIRFGFGGVLFLYVLQPLFQRLCSKLGEKRTQILATVFVLILLVDGGLILFKKVAVLIYGHKPYFFGSKATGQMYVDNIQSVADAHIRS